MLSPRKANPVTTPLEPFEQTHTHADVSQALSHLLAAELELQNAIFDPSLAPTLEEVALMRQARAAILQVRSTFNALAALCHEPSLPTDVRDMVDARKPKTSLMELAKPQPEINIPPRPNSQDR